MEEGRVPVGGTSFGVVEYGLINVSEGLLSVPPDLFTQGLTFNPLDLELGEFNKTVKTL